VGRRRGGAAQRLALGVMLATVAGCGSEAPSRYEARGVVREIYRDQAQVVIAHEDIAGLMPAMTMNFGVDRRALLDGVEPGQLIAFTLSYNGRDYRIVALDVVGTGRAGVAGRSSAAPQAALPAPPFALTDQDGRRLALRDLRGKAVLVEFIFTHCPGPCPALTGLHVDVQRALPPNARGGVHFVSISIDPARDTPEALRAYGEARGVDFENWSFLTGPEEAIAEVLRGYGVGVIPQSGGEIDHQIVTYLIDAGGNVSERYLGSGQSVGELVETLASLAPRSPPMAGSGD